MMTDKEKLVELLMASGEVCFTQSGEEIADHLIANGVTVQVRGRWVKHNFLGHEQWACSECQTLGSPQWKCCPVCEARMPQPPKGE